MDAVTIRTPQITPLAALYAKHYLSQIGGASSDYPVFRGASYAQRGDGLGDILRSIGRFLLPIAASVASAFVTKTASGINEGKSLKESARESLAPTARVAGTEFVQQMARKLTGGGRKRRRQTRTKKSAKASSWYKKLKRVGPSTTHLFGSGRKRKRQGKSKSKGHRASSSAKRIARPLLTPGINF